MVYAVTLLYAGLAGLLLLALSFQVVKLRRRHRVGLGTGDAPDLERAVRVHANFCEYTPLALLLLLLLEFATPLPIWILHALGLMLIIGRVLHALGLSRTAGTSRERFVGTVLTWLMLLISALLAVGVALAGLVFASSS